MAPKMKRLFPILVLLLAGCGAGGTAVQPPLNLAAIGDSISAGWLDPAASKVTGSAAISALYHPDAANGSVALVVRCLLPRLTSQTAVG
jgi:hypothetical protein